MSLMQRPHGWALMALIALVMPAAQPVQGQDVLPILVVDGLKTPTGVAVQPETGTIFVVESGARRIVKIVDGKPVPVIVDFGKDAFGKNPIYEIGPLSILFLKKDVLVIGGGGHPDGEDRLYGFKLPADDKLPIKADDAKLGMLKLAETKEAPAEGDFYALAKGAKGIYVTCNGDDKKGWLGRAMFNQEFALTNLSRVIPTFESVETTAPTAVTISPQGYVVVGNMGKTDANRDSRLSFFSEDGAHLDTFKLGLYDITGLAYGPEHGRLFATDFHWDDTKNGGLYKIVATRSEAGCKPVRIARLQRPTALAFGSGGDLYVTLAGDPIKTQPDGKLVVFKEIDISLTK